MKRDVTPQWFSYKESAIYSGLSEETLRAAINAGVVESKLVTLPGRRKGRRLISRDSLERWIRGEPRQEVAAK